jgi:hypothetical protein
MSSMARSVVVVSLLLGLASPAGAEWSSLHRSQFTNDCLKACQGNPKVDRSRHGECPTYCSCIVSEAERFISEAEYYRLEKVALNRGSDPNLDRLRALYPMCSKRVFAP